jgi:D-alanyl-D-alanine carboxypeptidase/Putative peptidoglycan binding domain
MPILLERGQPNIACEVQRWQFFLRRQGLTEAGAIDGDFGEKTEGATMAFQAQAGLPRTGELDARTFDAAQGLGYRDLDERHYTDPGSGFPARPSDLDSPGPAFRDRALGCFRFTQPPLAQRGDPDGILIRGSCDGTTGDWSAANIRRIVVPELAGVPAFRPPDGVWKVHRAAAEPILALFAAWAKADLMHLVLFNAGAFVPRYARKKSPGDGGHGERLSRDTGDLSNHAFGSAFDINHQENPLGSRPVPMGAKGCVRELVPIANSLGFFWGGHFSSRPDGMHFELARV